MVSSGLDPGANGAKPEKCSRFQESSIQNPGEGSRPRNSECSRKNVLQVCVSAVCLVFLLGSEFYILDSSVRLHRSGLTPFDPGTSLQFKREAVIS